MTNEKTEGNQKFNLFLVAIAYGSNYGIWLR